MKKFLFFILVLSSVTNILCYTKLISCAISEIIRHYYVERSEKFDFIVYGSKTEDLIKITNHIMKVNSGALEPTKMIHLSEQDEEFEVEQSAVLLFDSMKSYHEFHTRVFLVNEYPKDFSFLVYIAGADYSHLISSRTISNSSMFQFESFMVNDRADNALRLISFVKFQHSNCFDWEPFKVNKFWKLKKKWKNAEIFPTKFLNFNGCFLSIGVVRNEPSVYVQFDERKILKRVLGYTADINDVISKQLNYSVSYNPFDRKIGEFYNTSIVNDYFLMPTPLKYGHGINFYYTFPFTTSDDTILISKSAIFTPLEKMLLTFEIEVWTWLIITLLIAVITICILKLSPKRVQEFVIGKYVSSPILNLM